MAKERPSGSGEADASLLKELRDIARRTYELHKTQGRKDDEQKRREQTQGDTGRGEGRRRGFLGRAGSFVSETLAGAGRGAGLGALGGIVQSLFAPMKTGQEREAELLRSISAESSAQAAIAGTRALGGSEAMQMRAGQFAGDAAAAAVDAAYHPLMTKIQGVRSGMADLSQLAAAGVQVDDDFIRRRTASLREMEERRYEFDQRATSAISDEFRQERSDTMGEAQRAAEEAQNRFLRTIEERFDNAAARADGARDQDVRSTRAT